MRTIPFALTAALLAVQAVAAVPAKAARQASAPAAAQPAPSRTPTPAMQRVSFAFHSAFLLNLHHFLFDLARHPDQCDALAARLHAAPADAAVLRDAVAFYRNHYAERDLLFDEGMAAIKRTLSVDDARRDPVGLDLPDGLGAVLARAAPVYARLAWPTDDAANRAWIAGVQRLDARYGAAVQGAVERGLGSPFPRTPLRVDLVAETGKRQGAYTDTQAVIPSGRPSYQGLAALEMLYHEASHVQGTDLLEREIGQRLRAAGRSTDSELWHALQFATVGAATAAALGRDGIAYRPYADQAGLFARPWAGFAPLIETDWLAWLDGRESMGVALDRMVARLPQDP